MLPYLWVSIHGACLRCVSIFIHLGPGGAIERHLRCLAHFEHQSSLQQHPIILAHFVCVHVVVLFPTDTFHLSSRQKLSGTFCVGPFA